MQKKISNTLTYVMLIVVVLVTLFPVFYTFCASFKSNMEILVDPASLFPKKLTFDNYKIAWNSDQFQIKYQLANSIMYTVACVLIQLAISSMAGFAFAKGNFPFKNAIFIAISSLLFIQMGGITIYATFNILNFLHIPRNLFSLMFLKIFAVPVVNIYMVRSYVMGLPDGLLESAKIDGCTFFGTYKKIVLPLLKPVLATIAIFAFQGSWNEYIMPTIFTLTQPRQRTLIVGLMSLKNGSGAATSWNLMLAGSVVTMIPVLVMFAVCNRYFIDGVAAGAVKG